MSMNVLVVDDSGIMRAMILKSMRLSGLSLGEIYQAANGQEGLDALRQHWIDLAIIDINMPVMNGEEMIDRMKSEPEIRDIPIIVISTEGSELRKDQLKQKGVIFIHKPFTPETIRDTIKKIMKTGGSDDGSDSKNTLPGS